MVIFLQPPEIPTSKQSIEKNTILQIIEKQTLKVIYQYTGSPASKPLIIVLEVLNFVKKIKKIDKGLVLSKRSTYI